MSIIGWPSFVVKKQQPYEPFAKGSCDQLFIFYRGKNSMSMSVEPRQQCMSAHGKATLLAVFGVAGMTAMPYIAGRISELVSNFCLNGYGRNAVDVAAICAKQAHEVKMWVGIGGIVAIPILWAVMTRDCWCPRNTSVLSSSEV